MGPVKGLWPALGPPLVCFNRFQQGTPQIVIITIAAQELQKLSNQEISQVATSQGLNPKP